MIPWLQIHGKIHYGEWLPNFWSDISNLTEEIDQYMPSIFAHSITGKPYSSLPTDLWIEMKMNKGPKMKAGWQRILGNEAMLCANIKSRNYINQVRVKLHYIADIKSYKSGHKENTASRIKLDELRVEDACIVDFNCDPFDPENVQLSSLQSGQLVSKEVEDDLLSAYEDGETKVKKFFEERIFTRTKEWGISKCNSKTFVSVCSKMQGNKRRTMRCQELFHSIVELM